MSEPYKPLPRPLHENIPTLPTEDHMTFWKLVIRNFNWGTVREQSQILYSNRVAAPYEEEAP